MTTCSLCQAETILIVHGYPLCLYCDAHLDELRPLDAMKLLELGSRSAATSRTHSAEP